MATVGQKVMDGLKQFASETSVGYSITVARMHDWLC